MSIPVIKGTYSLDVKTVRALETLARRWRVSKSEALRRAIQMAERSGSVAEDSPQGAWEKLQTTFGLTADRAASWERDVRDERGASRPGKRTGRR